MTPAELALRLERDLQALASDAAWSTAASTGQPEGHYSDPIADAMSDAGVSDLTTATAAQLKTIRTAALGGCLDRLERHYATLVDTAQGSLSQKLSQTFAAISLLRERISDPPANTANTAIGANVRGRRRPDYTLGSGNVEYTS